MTDLLYDVTAIACEVSDQGQQDWLHSLNQKCPRRTTPVSAFLRLTTSGRRRARTTPDKYNSHWLKWHYRSKCESLIAFSNREFYVERPIKINSASISSGSSFSAAAGASKSGSRLRPQRTSVGSRKSQRLKPSPISRPATNSLTGKLDEEIREALGNKFPKHIYHSIVCIGALVAHKERDHWAVDALGAPHVGERPKRS